MKPGTRQDLLDPDPFRIAVDIANIVGGLSGAIALYMTYARLSVRASHRRTIAILGRTVRIFDEIDRELQEVGRIVAAAVLVERQPTPWVGPRVLLVPVQFTEYARRTEAIFGRLRDILKATHRLERAIRFLPYIDYERTREVVDIANKADDILRAQERAPGDLLDQVHVIVGQIREVCETLLRELEGRRS